MGQAQGVGAGGFPWVGGFVDVGGENLGGLDADLAEQGQAAGAGGG